MHDHETGTGGRRPGQQRSPWATTTATANGTRPRCLVPVRAGPSAKLRLAHVLSPAARAALVETMAAHVTGVLTLAGLEVELITEGGLNPALSAALFAGGVPALIVPGDLPWLQPDDVLSLLDEPGDVVVALADDGGTNALLLRAPLRPAFGAGSALRHLAAARAKGLHARGVRARGFLEDLDDEAGLVRARRYAPAFM